jgi:hypothetical protein
MRQRRFAAIGIVLAVGILGFAPARVGAASTAPNGSLGPGCAADRPAVAHHAGGVAADIPGKGHPAPIPCATNTGFRTSEVSIAVTNRGTVLFQPAFPETGSPIGVLRSADRGASWDFINPTTSPPRTVAIDMNMWVDRQTGRVFWSSELGPPIGRAPPRLDLSDSDGKTWVASSTLSVLYDHTQIFSGPPTKSQRALMQGYPNVVYVAVAGSRV